MTMMWLIMMWSEKESAIVDSSWQLVQQKHRLCEHKDDEEADENYPCNDDRNIFYFSSFNFQMNWHTTPIHALPCHEGKDFIKPNSNSNNILHCYNQVRVPFLLNASGISKPIFCTIALFPHSISSLNFLTQFFLWCSSKAHPLLSVSFSILLRIVFFSHYTAMLSSY